MSSWLFSEGVKHKEEQLDSLISSANSILDACEAISIRMASSEDRLKELVAFGEKQVGIIEHCVSEASLDSNRVAKLSASFASMLDDMIERKGGSFLALLGSRNQLLAEGLEKKLADAVAEYSKVKTAYEVVLESRIQALEEFAIGFKAAALRREG